MMTFLSIILGISIMGDSQACGMKPFVPETALTCKAGSSTAWWTNQNLTTLGSEVLVFLGSNDYGHPDPKPILARLKGKKCVWVGPPLIRGKDNGVADHLKREVEKDGTCAFLDTRTLMLKQPDGVHTSEPGRWLKAALNLLGKQK